MIVNCRETKNIFCLRKCLAVFLPAVSSFQYVFIAVIEFIVGGGWCSSGAIGLFSEAARNACLCYTKWTDCAASSIVGVLELRLVATTFFC